MSEQKLHENIGNTQKMTFLWAINLSKIKKRKVGHIKSTKQPNII